MEMAKSIEEYLSTVAPEWIKGVEKLIGLFRTTELKEELKWGIPTYTINKKNVASVSAFKNYFGVWFHNGVFLKDHAKVLINAQKNKTKGLRQWRFTTIDNMDEALILAYIDEAIQNQKENRVIQKSKPKSFEIPIELLQAFEKDPKLKEAYQTLSPYKRKEYCEHIGSAKRASTRLSRCEKCIPLLLQKIGLNDKYR